MAAWVPATRVSDQVFTLRRNPYFVGVDPDGNQLPYLDEVRFTFFADIQALNLATIAGEMDMQERHIQMTNYPVFKENEKSGKYRVITWPTFGGADAVVAFNQSYKADPELAKIMATKEFRIALSLAINRDQIKESVFLGLGEARQGVPAPWHPYFPGNEWAKKYTEYKPDEANKLLDGMGLAKKDGQGIRLMPNGKPLTMELSVVPAFAAWPDTAQLIAKDWEKVGVKTIVQIRERALHFDMRDANELQTEMWNEDTTAFPFTGNSKVDVRNAAHPDHGPALQEVVRDQGQGRHGASGPDQEERRAVDTARTVGPDGQVKAAQEIYRIWADNAYTIGTVGLDPDGPGGRRAQHPASQRTHDAGERLAAPEPGQRPARAVLLHEVAACRPGLVPPAMGRGRARPSRSPSSRISGRRPARLRHPGRRRLDRPDGSTMTRYALRRLILLPVLLFVFSVAVFAIVQAPPGDFLTAVHGDPRVLRQLGQRGAIRGAPQGLRARPAAPRPVLEVDGERPPRQPRPLARVPAAQHGADRRAVGADHRPGPLLVRLHLAGRHPDRDLLGHAPALDSVDYVITVLNYVGVATPNFMLALILMWVAYAYLGIGVTGLFSPEFVDAPWSVARVLNLLAHIWLPAVVLGVAGTARLTRVMRANLLDELNKPYVVTARAKGLPEWRLVLRYPVRLALNPLVSTIGWYLPALFSGSLIVATVMNIPNIGPLLLRALVNQDMYLAGSILLIYCFLAIIGTLVSDVLLAWLDPRIRVEN